MENFITGFPGREYQIRKALADVLGKEKAQFFFDKVYSSSSSSSSSNTAARTNTT